MWKTEDYQNAINKLPEATQKEIFEAMEKFRSQHAREVRRSGWSNKYNELSSNQRALIEKHIGDVHVTGDLTMNEKIYNILRNKFEY